MTFALIFCVFMLILGGALLGWLVRWNFKQGAVPVDPRDMARVVAERHAAERAAGGPDGTDRGQAA